MSTGALILTAALPGEIAALADGLRSRYYPPQRNRVPAHLTLFHALPPSAEAELGALLARMGRAFAPVPARLAGVLNLGCGTALRVESEGLMALRAEMALRLHGLLGAQDQGTPRLHITVQNKVAPTSARALQAGLATSLPRREFACPALLLHRHAGGRWQTLARFAFSGRNGAGRA